MSGNQRGYAWLDESIERSEQDEARAKALARRWSDLHNEDEYRRFARQADYEDGRDCGWEPDLCGECGGDQFLGLDGPRSRRYGTLNNLQDWQVGIKCPNPNCEDGYDMGPIREVEKCQREKEAERQLEIEIVEEKLERMGARMMRPYEHWNEDERYMEYQERDRD